VTAARALEPSPTGDGAGAARRPARRSGTWLRSRLRRVTPQPSRMSTALTTSTGWVSDWPTTSVALPAARATTSPMSLSVSGGMSATTNQPTRAAAPSSSVELMLRRS
jgi:hypothetical protein